MSYKIAVASSDGKVVNQHFGHCRQFLIFETDDTGKWEFIEKRDTSPACNSGEHSEVSMQQVVKLLEDCKAVVAAQIGLGAVQALMLSKIRAFNAVGLIEQVLEKVNETLNIKTES
ncbi:NifB/NifX family molybdenum-iron cluster-binding protein [Ruminiclostridium josui]|uniref:NifB/NifX family molybdenum-iron cluster-binding protein n=1 Tax=Ruminiclostridium josui TaxID=1499 RepID=UPI000465DB4E|nr:NifB/NifX family molybdenum-iron cluster-binding protein [Ruminiclostridium josui]